ncbi:MAG: cytochrome bd-I oxidase subunit CydX [Alphaproteobacteria bacterium]
MWYFAWILGLGLASSFAILNAMWYEMREDALSAKPSPRKS